MKVQIRNEDGTLKETPHKISKNNTSSNATNAYFDVEYKNNKDILYAAFSEELSSIFSDGDEPIKGVFTYNIINKSIIMQGVKQIL